MPHAESGELALYWEAHGEGSPLVFVHGSGGNTLVWWQQVPHFARRHRIVSYDQRGFGRSRCPQDGLHPRHLADDVGRVLDAAGIERAALVCQSLGGWAGLPFALAQPDRVSALVLCGTPGGLATPGVLADFRRLAEGGGRRSVLELALGPRAIARDPARAYLYDQIQRLNPPDTLPRLLAGVPEVRVDEAALADFAVPTLVLGGSEDAFFRPATLAEVAGCIPGARHQVVPGCGHSPYFEAPEEFNRRVEDFLVDADD